MPKHININIGEYRGVWVIIEHLGGKATSVSWEMLTAGRQLAAELGGPLGVVVIGESGSRLATEAFAYGADVAYMISGPAFKHYRTETYVPALIYMVKRYHPEILLLGETANGCDLSSALAVDLQTGVTADCTQFNVATPRRDVEMTRPVCGGTMLATVACERHRPQIATVRPHVMPAPARHTGHVGRIERVEFKMKEEEIAARILGFTTNDKHAIELMEAEVIVAVGRGLGSKVQLRKVEALAHALGGVVGATRAVVECGWLPADRQIGMTGTTVRPRLYIAVGISGAARHLAGMKEAGTIIAINNDPSAPIFSIATHGIVGDWLQVVPEMTRQLRSR